MVGKNVNNKEFFQAVVDSNNKFVTATENELINKLNLGSGIKMNYAEPETSEHFSCSSALDW